MHGSRESDSSIVPRKPSNKGRAAARAAERVEGRGLAKGNAREQSRLRTLGRESLNQALARIRQTIRQRPGAQLTALWHHVDSVDTLQDAFYGLNGKEIKRRCVTRPTQHQAILLQRLGMVLPARMKITNCSEDF